MERADHLTVGGKRRRYVVEFFGLSLPPIPVGMTRRQWASRENWIKRREKFGESGVSARGEHNLNLNLVAARVGKARVPRITHCTRGHKFTALNTRVSTRGRHCRACDQIRSGRLTFNRRQRKYTLPALLAKRSALRQRLIWLGGEAQRHPESKHWRNLLVGTGRRYQELKAQIAAVEKGAAA